MMMINIRRIIAANEMRFADESHSSKFKRKKKKRKKNEAGRKKKERRKVGEKKKNPAYAGRSVRTALIIQFNGVN